MNAYLPFDKSLGNVFVTQGIGGTRSHYDWLYNSWDFAVPYDTPVLAIADGYIVDYFDGAQGGQMGAGNSGNIVTIRHDDGFYSSYFHLAPGSIPDAVKTEIDAGREVRVLAGEIVGKVGNTGDTDGPHIHLTVGTDTIHWGASTGHDELIANGSQTSNGTVPVTFHDVLGGIPYEGQNVISENTLVNNIDANTTEGTVASTGVVVIAGVNEPMYPSHTSGEYYNEKAFAAINEFGAVVTWGAHALGGDSSAVANALNGTIDVKQIYSMAYAFAALRADGSVIIWGSTDPNDSSTQVALEIPASTADVVKIYSTGAAFAILYRDGSVTTVGDPSSGGNSSGITSELVDVKQIYSNWSAFAALRADGSVVTWGDSHHGGDNSNIPNVLDGAVPVTQIFSTGYAFAALRADGTVITWGHAARGGDSSSITSELKGVQQISGTWGAFAALRADGSVITWGEAANGGDNSHIFSELNGAINALDVVKIYSTGHAFAALRADGSVVTWGNALWGGNSSAVAGKLNGSIPVKQIYSTGTAFAALREDGTVVTWGSDGGNSSSVAGELINVTEIYSTYRAFAALRTDGSVITWGNYLHNQGSVVDELDGTIPVTQIYATGLAFAALRADGSVVTWGPSDHGGSSSSVASQLGSGIVGLNNIYTDDFYNGNSIAPILETRINTTTSSDQWSQSFTALNDGGFVASWVSRDQDGSGHGIYAQRYDANGFTLGGEFRVNTHTIGDQFQTGMATLNNGGFVLSWVSDGQDGSSHGIYARLYDANGIAQGDEFQVNTYTTNIQDDLEITALNNGGFVVTWRSLNQDGDSYGVYAQRYDASGGSLGGEFRVNTYTNGFQSAPSITTLQDSSFLISWHSTGLDGSNEGVFARRYDANGVELGNEFQVNTYTIGNQSGASVAALQNGGFVVSWHSQHQDGSGWGVYAQRYDANSVPQGGEFRVNTTIANDQLYQKVIALKNGGFVVSWMSDRQDGSNFGVYAQRYDANGIKQGDEFQVNAYTDSNQWHPTMTALKDGGFIIGWHSFGQDSSGWGVYGKRYDANGNEIDWTIPYNNDFWQINPSATTASESDGLIEFTITRPNDRLGFSETVYISTTQVHGSLNEGDYAGLLNKPHTFAVGESSKQVTVNILPDSIVETDETFGLIVQENPTDPLETYLTSTTFTIQDNSVINHPPTGSVTISDTTPEQGQVLTASNDLIDVDGLGEIAYQWKVGDIVVGDENTYTVTANDVGKSITITASYTDGLGNLESVSSSSSEAVAAQPLQSSLLLEVVNLANFAYDDGTTRAEERNWVPYSGDGFAAINSASIFENGILTENKLHIYEANIEGSRTLALAFEGTNNPLDIFFQSGFWKILYDKHRPEIQAAIDYASSAEERGEKKFDNMIVTGHSLGGILTEEFFAADLNRTTLSQNAYGITFGSPGSTNPAISENKLLNFATIGDPVAALHSDTFFGMVAEGPDPDTLTKALIEQLVLASKVASPEKAILEISNFLLTQGGLTPSREGKNVNIINSTDGFIGLNLIERHRLGSEIGYINNVEKLINVYGSANRSGFSDLDDFWLKLEKDYLYTVDPDTLDIVIGFLQKVGFGSAEILLIDTPQTVIGVTDSIAPILANIIVSFDLEELGNGMKYAHDVDKTIIFGGADIFNDQVLEPGVDFIVDEVTGYMEFIMEGVANTKDKIWNIFEGSAIIQVDTTNVGLFDTEFKLIGDYDLERFFVVNTDGNLRIIYSENKFLTGGADGNTIIGGKHDDILAGNDASNTIFGATGNDLIFPKLGADIITTGPGVDVVSGSLKELDGIRVTDFNYKDSLNIIGANPEQINVSLEQTPSVALLTIETPNNEQAVVSLDGNFRIESFLISEGTEGANINYRNQTPIANDDILSLEEDIILNFTTLNLLSNDTDIDGDVLFVSALDTSSTLGLVTDNGDGTFGYNPNGVFEYLHAGEKATDSFIYTVSDGNGGNDTATVAITINGVNDDPVLNSITGTSISDYLAGTDSADIIYSLGGSYDKSAGGSGADVFAFGVEALNGIRERDVILDYEAGIDSILLEDGAAVGTMRPGSFGTVIFLEGDSDAIYVNGVSPQDITFA